MRPRVWSPEYIAAILPPALRERWRGREKQRIKWARHLAAVHGVTLAEELARMAGRAPKAAPFRPKEAARLFALAPADVRTRYGGPNAAFVLALRTRMRSRREDSETAARRMGTHWSRRRQTAEEIEALSVIDREVAARYGAPGQILHAIRRHARRAGLSIVEAARTIRVRRSMSDARIAETLALVDPVALLRLTTRASRRSLAYWIERKARTKGISLEEAARSIRPRGKPMSPEERRRRRNDLARRRRREDPERFRAYQAAYRERHAKPAKPVVARWEGWAGGLPPALPSKPAPAKSPAAVDPKRQRQTAAISRNRHCGTCRHCGLGRCTLDASLHAGEDLVCNLYKFDGFHSI